MTQEAPIVCKKLDWTNLKRRVDQSVIQDWKRYCFSEGVFGVVIRVDGLMEIRPVPETRVRSVEKDIELGVRLASLPKIGIPTYSKDVRVSGYLSLYEDSTMRRYELQTIGRSTI